MVVYLEYLFSGVLVFVFNKVFHKKISEHACGIMAAALVYIASLKTKRHTFSQLVGGSIVSVAVILIIYGFIRLDFL